MMIMMIYSCLRNLTQEDLTHIRDFPFNKHGKDIVFVFLYAQCLGTAPWCTEECWIFRTHSESTDCLSGLHTDSDQLD